MRVLLARCRLYLLLRNATGRCSRAACCRVFIRFGVLFPNGKNGVAYLFSVGANPQPVAQRIDTKVSILLGLHLPLFLSLAQIRDRRPLRYGERQSGYHCVSFANYSQFTDSVLLHMRVILHRRDITVSRNSLVGGCGRHLQATIINKLYRRVRRPRRTVSND